MRDYKIINKTYDLIKSMLANNQQWCIEFLLEINHEILSRFNDVVKTKESEISKLIDEMFSNFDVCVKLLADEHEINVTEKASQCLI